MKIFRNSYSEEHMVIAAPAVVPSDVIGFLHKSNQSGHNNLYHKSDDNLHSQTDDQKPWSQEKNLQNTILANTVLQDY